MNKNKKLNPDELESIAGGNTSSEKLQKSNNKENNTEVVGLLKMYGGPGFRRNLKPKISDDSTAKDETIDTLANLSGNSSLKPKK